MTLHYIDITISIMSTCKTQLKMISTKTQNIHICWNIYLYLNCIAKLTILYHMTTAWVNLHVGIIVTSKYVDLFCNYEDFL